MPLGKLRQRRQVGTVAIHAEHRFGDDQFAARALLQQLVEMVEIAVAENLRAGLHSAAGMHDAGMVQLVAEDCRFFDAGQCRDHRGIGLKTAGKQQGGLATLEGGQLFLDRQGDVARAGHQPRGRSAGTVALRPFRSARLHLRMLAQAKIIVRRRIDQRTASGIMQLPMMPMPWPQSAQAFGFAQRYKPRLQQVVQAGIHLRVAPRVPLAPAAPRG